MTATYEIRSTHIAHRGCSYRGADHTDITDSAGEVSRAAVAIAEVIHARESMDGVGGGGNIGCGSRSLEIVEIMDDGSDGESWDLLDYDGTPLKEWPAVVLALPVGRIDPELVAELSAPCWDGSNHTSPDVEAIARIAGCHGGVFGHCEADDWCNENTEGMDADEIVREAASMGVHLDERAVERMVADHANR